MSPDGHAASKTRTVGTGSYVLGALGGSIRGYELGVVAGALLFAGPALHLSPSLKGAVVSSALFGSLLGALAVGPASDRYGRRKMIAGAGALYAVGILGAALAPGAGVMIAARTVLGLGVGIATAMIPVYISEIAPARSRGASASLFQLMITIGVLAASIVSYVLSFSGGWRWMFAIGVFPALIMLAGAFFLPESPRWLIRQGREQDARAVLRRSRDPGSLDAEIEQIKETNRQAGQQLRLAAVLTSPALRRLLLIGSVLGILQQFTGINAVTYFSPSVLKSIGYSSSASILANVGFSVLGLLSTAVMVFFVIDKIGRKKPLMFGALGMALSMAILGAVFAADGASHGAGGYIAIICLALFQVMFGLSWGGIVWTVLGEMFPLRARGTAMGIATLFTEGSSVVISQFFPQLLATGVATVFFIFAAFGVVAFAWTAFMVPETRNRSLEDIEAGQIRPDPTQAPVRARMKGA
ncbi:MAG TPA: sugar porter family MFS transporter [Streptosporangiaceae bacterium]|nr:sugar porter family MFS transporter [Streptosporangiaceae bacterium]